MKATDQFNTTKLAEEETAPNSAKTPNYFYQVASIIYRIGEHFEVSHKYGKDNDIIINYNKTDDGTRISERINDAIAKLSFTINYRIKMFPKEQQLQVWIY